MSNNRKYTEYEYNEVKEKVPEHRDVPKYGYGIRHIQLIIFLLSLTVNFLARGHLGVTIVAMTSHDNEETGTSNTTVHNIGRNDTSAVDTIGTTDYDLDSIVSRNYSIGTVDINNTTEKHKIFNWPKSTQEMVLNSFFVGYCIMMFPFGMVCQRWGGKIPLQIALFVNGIVSITTPWLTIWGGWKAVCFCRILQGLSQAGTYPSLQTLLSKWVPASERATLSSYVYTGASLGHVIALQLGGFLGGSRWGWPSTFWVVGAICLISFVLLTIFGTATPLEHKTISQEEKNFIQGNADVGNVRKPKTPWRAIIRSKPVWSTIATQIGSGVAYVFFFNQVPTYIHYILGSNVKNSGVLSSLPYLASLFTSIAFGCISDYCINHNIVSLRNARRISNSIADCGVAFSLMCVSFTQNTTIAVACLVFAMSTHMGSHTGWMVNHIDLTPNFSGTLMALGNTFMNIFIILSPILVSNVVTDLTNVIQWRIIFFIIAGLCFICNVIFVLLMSSETQPWNYYDSNETCPEDQKLENAKEMKEKSEEI